MLARISLHLPVIHAQGCRIEESTDEIIQCLQKAGCCRDWAKDFALLQETSNLGHLHHNRVPLLGDCTRLLATPFRMDYLSLPDLRFNREHVCVAGCELSLRRMQIC